MARKFAQVKVSIWDSPDFRALSVDAQRLYFVLMTRVETSLAGVIPWHAGRFSSLAAGSSPDLIEKAAAELERARFVVIDRITEECLLRTMVRHDDALQRGPKIAAGVVAAWQAIYSTTLRSVVADEVSKAAVSDSVAHTIQPILDWRTGQQIDSHIGCPTENPTEHGDDTPSDTPSEGTSGEASGQPATGNQQPATSRADELFARFWSVYPRRIAKKAAEKAWIRAIRLADPEVIISAADQYAAVSLRADPRFLKHPSTWLDGGCWDDEATPDSEPDGWMNA